MATFHLQVVSMDGLEYDGDVERITLRTVNGDVATASIVLPGGETKKAACIGGMLSVMDGECHVIPTTWEWSDEIDLDRAQAAKARAEERLKDAQLTKEARVRAEAKLYRALVRIGTADGKK